jgi:hypothetical protein
MSNALSILALPCKTAEGVVVLHRPMKVSSFPLSLSSQLKVVFKVEIDPVKVIESCCRTSPR